MYSIYNGKALWAGASESRWKRQGSWLCFTCRGRGKRADSTLGSLTALQFIQVFHITTLVYQLAIKSLVILSKYLLVLRNPKDGNHLWKHPSSIRNTSIFILISTSWHSSTKILYFSQSGFICVIETRLKNLHLRRFKWYLWYKQ